MTAAFSATWQVFRLGLHPSFKGRAAYSILSNAFAVSKQSPSRFNGRLELFQGAPQHLKPWGFSHPLRTILPNSNRLQGQSRCVNLWMPPPKDEVPGKMTAKKELSLSSADIEKVFGRKMDTEKGAEILMTLQRHRGEGTLDQKIPYSKALISKGLAYLRSVDPINEDAAIIARIDRETDTSPQAVSQFDKLRREIKRRRELQEGIREAEEKRKSEQAGRATSKEIAKKGTTNQSNELVELRKEPEWVRKYREEATNHDEELVKKLSVWSRLLPSAAITFTVVSLSFLFAQSYTPPSRDARLFPNIPPAAATLMALIGINCIVFLMWGIPPLWQFTNRNFLIAPVYPHCMSMIGGAFSHQQFTHLFVNSFMIWLVGTKGRCLSNSSKWSPILRINI